MHGEVCPCIVVPPLTALPPSAVLRLANFHVRGAEAAMDILDILRHSLSDASMLNDARIRLNQELGISGWFIRAKSATLLMRASALR